MVFNRVLRSCTSTNTVLKEAIKTSTELQDVHGIWVSSLQQTGGKGQHSKTWVSPVGNLYLSIAFNVLPYYFNFIPLTVAAAIGSYLQQLKISFEIKWPNDLYIAGKKVAGILCESVVGPRSFIIVGIGLNCNKAPLNSTCLLEHLKKKIPLKEVRTKILQETLKQIASLDLNEIYAFYQKHAYFKPLQKIQFQFSEQMHLEGHIIGLDHKNFGMQVQTLQKEKMLLTHHSIKIL